MGKICYKILSERYGVAQLLRHKVEVPSHAAELVYPRLFFKAHAEISAGDLSCGGTEFFDRLKYALADNGGYDNARDYAEAVHYGRGYEKVEPVEKAAAARYYEKRRYDYDGRGHYGKYYERKIKLKLEAVLFHKNDPFGRGVFSPMSSLPPCTRARAP